MHKIRCDDGRRYLIYHSSDLGYLDDHVPDKWYFHTYPLPRIIKAGAPFATPEEAEQAARETDRVSEPSELG